MKNYIKVILSLMLIFLSGCSNSNNKFETETKLITIPDVSNMNIDDAKSIINSRGLLAVSEELCDDTIEKGRVIKTEPEKNSEVEEDTKVVIYVSSGPNRIDAKSITFTWYHLGQAPDNWDQKVNCPIIEDGYLYFYCYPIFGTNFNWKESAQEDVIGFGKACLTDVFDKTVPAYIIPDGYDTTMVTAGQETNFWIKVPIKQLDTDLPTDLYCEFFVIVNGIEQTLKINFAIEW